MKTNNHKDINLERIIFFSDAVFAIAITILALEIRLPEEDSSLGTIFHDLLPGIVAYLFGFVQIAIFWTAHHTLFKRLVNYDFRVIWLNFMFLMIIAFIPVPVSAMIKLGINKHTIVFMYTCLALLGMVEWIIWYYITLPNKHLTDRSLSANDKTVEHKKIAWLVGIFLFGILIANLNAYTAAVLSLSIPFVHSFIKTRNRVSDEIL